MNKIIYLRDEINKNEFRTPLIPTDINILIKNNFIIYVESSNTRIYQDDEYINNGAIITYKKWYEDEFKDALIIGLKQFDNINKLNNHKHIYFAHCYKNQKGSELILNYFFKSNSIIYDMEYFIGLDNKRLISFGYYAGIVGGFLGLLQYYYKEKFLIDISELKYWSSINEIFEIIFNLKDDFNNLKILIIGEKGNCGKGVSFFLEKYNIIYSTLNKKDLKNNLINFDIIFNCINLKDSFDEIWFDNDTIFNKKMLIIDISCDYLKHNNPIKLYNKSTTFLKPVFNYNKYVDIIALNNLPSLLPFDSSNYFSNNFVNILLDIDDKNNYLKNNKNIFLDNYLNL